MLFLGVFFLTIATDATLMVAVAAGIAAPLFFYLWCWRRMSLTPIAWSEVKTAQKAGWFVMVVTVFLSFFQ
ncbi:MAG: hypothetical protein V4772_23190 [Pseudomonadota bacterium]